MENIRYVFDFIYLAFRTHGIFRFFLFCVRACFVVVLVLRGRESAAVAAPHSRKPPAGCRPEGQDSRVTGSHSW